MLVQSFYYTCVISFILKGKGKMTTYWLMGEKDQIASQPEILGPDGSEMNISPQNEIGASSNPGIGDEPNAPEVLRKAHFVEDVSKTEDRSLDSNIRSSKNNIPSESSHPSHHHNHPPAHIISNPLTSIDDQQPTSPHR